MNSHFHVCAGVCFFFFVWSEFSRADPLSGENVRDAKRSEFPFVAVFQVKDNQGVIKHCSGSIISKKHVLTAAQCLPGHNQSTYNIKLCIGSLVLTECHSHESKSWITYDEWSKKKQSGVNDIAVITLANEVNETLGVEPATVSTEKKDKMYLKTLRLVGWGTNGTDTKTTKDVEFSLKTTAVKVMTNKKCEFMNSYRKSIIPSAHIREAVLCTYADPYAVIDSVDLGGPLFHDKGIVGVNVGKEILCLAFHDEETTVNTHMSTDYYREFINYFITGASDNEIPQVASNSSRKITRQLHHNESSTSPPTTSDGHQTQSTSGTPTTPKNNQTDHPEVSGSCMNEFTLKSSFFLVTLSIVIKQIS